MNSIRIVLPGAPRTKKTSNRVFHIGQKCRGCGRGSRAVVQPSKAWADWCDSLSPILRLDMRVCTGEPIAFAVNCAAKFYREADRGDMVGFMQGLADLLQHGGVVADDKWITSWDGSQLLKDARNPRVELVLTRKELPR